MSPTDPSLHVFAERRLELGLSQADLADAMGVTRPQVSNIEAGRGMPNLDKLVPMCEALDCSADWLLGLVGDDH